MKDKRLSERITELLESQLTPAVMRSLRKQGEVLMRRALEHAKAENLDRYTALLDAYIKQLRVLAVWKALAEYAEQSGDGRADDIILRILEKYDIKLIPPPKLSDSVSALAPPEDKRPF